MKENIGTSPQGTFLFRAISFISRFRFSYLHRSTGQRQWPLVLFVLITGSAALGIISLAAWLTKLPLLFPPLGPSAFILFYTPMSEQASPRSVFVSHAMGVSAGFAALWIMNWIFPDAGLLTTTSLGVPRILTTALAMALVTAWISPAEPCIGAAIVSIRWRRPFRKPWRRRFCASADGRASGPSTIPSGDPIRKRVGNTARWRVFQRVEPPSGNP